MTLLLQILTLIGSVAMLMYGMKVMSEGLQKMAGGTLSRALGTMTTNRFSGVLTGAFITASIQSSTATTVMTVSFVSAGILSLAQAISVIMGANIGTTFTAWIMVLGGSGFDMRLIVYLAILIAVVLIYTKKNASMGEFIIGLAFMLLGLTTLKINASEMHLDQMTPVVHFFETTSSWGYGSYFLYLLIGGMLTFAVQSSAAIMAITMTLCSTHVMPIDMGIALVMGENIGTTITSNVVALSASTQARRAAMAHLVFNLFGVVWVLCVFRWFVKTICMLWGVDFTPGVVNNEIGVTELNAILATFHTAFNVCNVIILIGFVPQLERLVMRIIPEQRNDKNREFVPQFYFVNEAALRTPVFAIRQVRLEIEKMANVAIHNYDLALEMVTSVKDGVDYPLGYTFPHEEEFRNNEKQLNFLNRQLVNFIIRLNALPLSEEDHVYLTGAIKSTSDIERVGDYAENITEYAHILVDQKAGFSETAKEEIEVIREKIFAVQQQVMKAYMELDTDALARAAEYEEDVDNLTDKMESNHIERLTAGKCSAMVGQQFLELASDSERISDHWLNVGRTIKDLLRVRQ